MPKLTAIDTVYHVGTLNKDDRVRAESQEGHLLSVSEHPDEWEEIAECGGDRWEMTREGAVWLDAVALTDEEEAEISDWAVREGYAQETPLWRAWRFDTEAERWEYFLTPSEEMALSEVDEHDLENGKPPSADGKLVDPVTRLTLTERGLAAVGRMPEAAHALDAVIILWADTVLKPQNDDLMGVWWHEDYAPEILSCPRGGVFPDRLCEFEIESDLGMPPPLSFIEEHWAEREDDLSPDPAF